MTFKGLGFSQRDSYVVVLYQASLGQVDFFNFFDFGDFCALIAFGVPSAEVEHVAFVATGQARAASTGSELGVEAFGFELGDEFFEFFTARRGIVEGGDGPTIVIAR